ncbi:MAG: D-alanyl-D-alanine carboxypeptidase/D-alanyl-D-alanine-endopeptidase [Fibrobacter sp.]|nr:D-alanyl-D-alanine carboxypeptidase/D-alanyl-D-alanine-endopeptidase [Fibrobacter sp.]
MYRFAAFIISCVLISEAAAISSDSVQKGVENYLQSRKYTGKGIGVVIKDLDRDSVVVSINGDEMLNPASVSKLVTGAAALEILGNDFCFKTRVFIDGTFNPDSGIVNGNLYIQGGGDPGFSAERLWLFVQHLYHLGLRTVTGNLVLDDNFFDSVTVGPGFDEDSSSRAYQPLISALSASFSSLAIHHRSGSIAGSPVHVDVFPRIQGIKVVSSAKTAIGKSSSIDIRTVPTTEGTNIIVNGSMSLEESPKYTYRKVWQTWQAFGGALMSLFSEYGISINGKMLHGTVPGNLAAAKPFYEFTSEPLPTFIDHMFKYSSNFAAEMVLKTLAASGSGPGSWEKGTAGVLSWWDKCKLPGKPVIHNGSGMGNLNRISAMQIAELLSHVNKQKSYSPEYIRALSVAGVDGTLKSRFKNSKLKGIVRAKTGTLNSLSVHTLAGYILLPEKTYSFAILCNKVGSGQYDNWIVQEGILERFKSVIDKELWTE